MLEQIHATAEDQRKTQMIVALGMVAFATYALIDATLTGWTTLSAAGLLFGGTGAAMLNWVRHHATVTPKRLAL
ncbi:MAG TPA: hypothetical protein VFJ16_04725 [Longimicrobium sp.]|nr:hypothetical protein [Longimicrobium sp.]